MRKGHLGLPLSNNPDGQTSIHLGPFNTSIFYEFARQHPFGKKAKEEIIVDLRFKAIEGKRLSNGSGSINLKIDHLVAWYLYRANEVGIEQAKNELDEFLARDTVDVIATLWLYGVTTKDRVAICDGIEIVPIEQMPLSEEKYDYQQFTLSHHGHLVPTPHAALVKKITIPKIESETNPPNDTASRVIRHLTVVAILMNAIPGVCSMPGFETFYRTPGTPMYPFGGASGGASIFDILPNQRFEFDPRFAGLLTQLISAYEKLPNRSQRRIASALHRLAQAKGRFDDGSICLDVGIALEMLLLNSEHENQELPGQLSLHFRLRGSWLIGKDVGERREAYKTLGKIYAFRSQVAHNGFSDELLQMEYKARKEMLLSHVNLAESILKHLILYGPPAQWASLILGEQTSSSA